MQRSADCKGIMLNCTTAYCRWIQGPTSKVLQGASALDANLCSALTCWRLRVGGQLNYTVLDARQLEVRLPEHRTKARYLRFVCLTGIVCACFGLAEVRGHAVLRSLCVLPAPAFQLEIAMAGPRRLVVGRVSGQTCFRSQLCLGRPHSTRNVGYREASFELWCSAVCKGVFWHAQRHGLSGSRRLLRYFP